VSLIRDLSQNDSGDAELLGGKGWNLAVLLGAGLPVPPAFCITSLAHRQAKARENNVGLDAALRGDVAAAYRQLGGGPVAVRSSATLEDGAVASFAGLQETYLGIEGEAALADAVERCWRSLDSLRARAYRAQQNIDERQVAMAVVVQRLVDAEASGVLFTHNPLDATGKTLLVEAAWGLGEAVVSGLVNPDRFQLDRITGELIEQHVSNKPVRVTRRGEEPVPAEIQSLPSLDVEQLRALADLARRVETLYGEPRDVEWAWAEGEAWLLQARPVTTVGAHEREQARGAEIARLAALADPKGTVWARYNLAEVLAAPTPMTWAIVRHFMSGQGGLGLMFRDLGFDPDPVLDELGPNDLVCGRTYVNLSREAKMHFRGFPYGHSLAELKEHPERAIYPQPKPDPAQVGPKFLLKLPGFLLKMLRASSRIRGQSASLAGKLQNEVFPKFVAEVRAEAAVNLSSLTSQQLLARLKHWIASTLDELARDSLKPATLAAAAMAKLEQGLTPGLGQVRAAVEVRSLLTGAHPPAEADLPAALRALGEGRLSRAEFLERFGHRGPKEMELAEPRWRERPELLPSASRSGAGEARAAHAATADGWPNVSEAAKLKSAARQSLGHQLETARTYMALREASKHYLMLGYGLIRRILLELAERYRLGDGVFYLTPDELPRLVAGQDLSAIIAQRRRERMLLLSFELPAVLFSDDLEAVGRPHVISGAAELTGTPVSAGVAEGPALVLSSPQLPPGTADGFVLVCPSTDPAWVPLFLQAKALLMETGGILSHGAIVAREFGLPAVVGIADVQQAIRTGQRVRVDGNTGLVHLFE